MNELIKVNYENADRPTVSGRELWEALEVGTPYHKWIARMCEYGFSENVDFVTVDKKVRRADGAEMPQTQHDHQITIPMAKELCMLQRTEKGKFWRQYFIGVEEKWNSPEAIMARALQFSNAKLKQLETHCCQLETTVAVQEQQIAELQPKASYYDVVLNCKDLLSITTIAKDYGKSGVWLNRYLHENGVQYKQGQNWLLYQKYAEKGYTSTKTQTFNGMDGQQHTKVHTYWTQKGRLFIYDLLKANGLLPLIEQDAV